MLEPYEDSIDLIDYVPQSIRGQVLLSPKLEDSRILLDQEQLLSKKKTIFFLQILL